MRRSHTAALKAKAALEAVAGEKSIAELAARFEVHPTLLAKWKKQLLSGVPDIFSDKRKTKDEDDEAEKSRLYEEIGRLKVELDWLKKKAADLTRH